MRLQRFSRAGAIVMAFAMAVVAIQGQEAEAQPVLPVRLSGYVYVDRNNDGMLAFDDLLNPNDHPELVIKDVTIGLFSIVGTNTSLLSTTMTNEHGLYQFLNLDPGTYMLREVQPFQYLDGTHTLGQIRDISNPAMFNPPGSNRGAAGADSSGEFFTNIVLPSNSRGDEYNFGERGLLAQYVSKRNLLSSAPAPLYAPEVEISSSPLPEPASGVLALVALSAIHRLRRRTVGFLA